MSTASSFVVDCAGPDGFFGVFEDDGATGYLYLYKPDEGVQRHVHVYDRGPALEVSESDVQVFWSSDGKKVGVVIWGKMRAIIDLTGREGRVWMETRSSPGIEDRAWLRGFAL